MILKIYKFLLMLQIVGSTMLGFITFQVSGLIVGFVAGVVIAGHFLTVINTRDINAENTKLLKAILEEFRKTRISQEKLIADRLDGNQKALKG